MDIEDKEGINTTKSGMDYLLDRASNSVKNIPMRQVITSFAGLRAHESSDDFIIEEVKDAKISLMLPASNHQVCPAHRRLALWLPEWSGMPWT